MFNQYDSAYNSSLGSLPPAQERIPLSGGQWQGLERELTSSKNIDSLIQQFRNTGFIISTEEDMRKSDAERQKLVEEGKRKIQSGQAKIEHAQLLKAEAQQLREEAQQERAAIAKERQDILTKMFYGIFNKQNLPVETANTIFTTYLADASLSMEKTDKGESFAKINSMNGVIKYLTDHPNTKACDFRHFEAAVNDIPTLAESLKKSSVKAIAFQKGIPVSEAAKASLDEAIAARKGGLKVQYL